MKATKIKPESSVEWTVLEVHMVPESNEVTMRCKASDGEVKQIHKTVDVQDIVDSVNDTILDGINDYFRQIAADIIGVSASSVTGGLFSKSSSGA